MTVAELERALRGLQSAEEFFELLEVRYDPDRVRVNRLHILQRFHHYIDRCGPPPDSGDARRLWYGTMLAKAHDDFVRSTPQQAQIFAVFRQPQAAPVEIPLAQLLAGKRP